MASVAERITSRGAPQSVIAAEIGVGLSTLRSHLSGEHVRSDSKRKYQDWLAGRRAATNVFVLHSTAADAIAETGPSDQAARPASPRLVVDIFSGCGGLSLGFDLLDEGTQFRTILALDSQSAPIATLNRNAGLLGHRSAPVGRQTDLTEFLNETEFLAFYVDHAARGLEDAGLAEALRTLKGGRFPAFLNEVAAVDARFLEALNAIRAGRSWLAAYDRLARQALSQTSVLGFHDKLRLPRPSSKVASLPLILWGDRGGETPVASRKSPASAPGFSIERAAAEWNEELWQLSAKKQSAGKGQLGASSRRVASFVSFLDQPAMVQVREVWIRWRAERLALRIALFEDEAYGAALQKLYSEKCPVSVLVGGPPCQGFSRIGRGKIRSLKDAKVHVHGHAEAGDARNLLFRQYVLVLGALRPAAFLFENVQHFQSVVKSGGVTFQATEVLAEAIATMSDGAATYEVKSKILDASQFGIPQTRQRYFMAGVLAAGDTEAALRDAETFLDLARDREAPLALALAGLPPAGFGAQTLAILSAVDERVSGDHPFVRWIRQPCPLTKAAPTAVDAHTTRRPRADDAAFFSLMGPGRRWMDYRSDEAKTLLDLKALVKALLEMPQQDYAALAAKAQSESWLPDRAALADLDGRIDGALPLRLLLEQSGWKLGAANHLLTDSYLEKRDGNHGDWIARMDSTRPAKTMVSHMGKDTYAFVHPSASRTLSVRESARIQSFPDWFSFGDAALTDAFKMVGNAVPPMLSGMIAHKVSHVLARRDAPRARLTRPA